MIANIFNRSFDKQVPIAPLVTFRIVFGLLMFASIVRFWWRGWVTSVYIQPHFHFTYQGFEWVQPLSSICMHVLFACIAVATLMIALGLLYRLATIFFFLAFTYVELIDVTTYLNHYYFISLIALLLIFLPTNRNYALDVVLKLTTRKQFVPAWCIGILKFQLGIVYVFAGLAKLNADWLLHAIPMRIWLPAKTHLPLVGGMMYEPWVAYFFSWFGAFYDLFIVFFLLNARTRPLAYFFVIIFHVATAIFFPGIGMFPFVMIICSLIFLPANFHQKALSFLPFYESNDNISPLGKNQYRTRYKPVIIAAIGLYVIVQVIIPLRFLCYPGHLFWHEEGYRFSWRVMLMEKSGAAYFTVKDKKSAQQIEVNNAEFLTPLQEKMMSTQPDLILKYAHFLADHYKKKNMQQPEVYSEVYVALNGQRSRLFTDTTVNLAQEKISWSHYNWVLPYQPGQSQ